MNGFIERGNHQPDQTPLIDDSSEGYQAATKARRPTVVGSSEPQDLEPCLGGTVASHGGYQVTRTPYRNLERIDFMVPC